MGAYDYGEHENVIEFLKNQEVATVTFSQGRFISHIRKLSEKYPDKVQLTSENKDGSIVAHIPVDFIGIRPKRILTEEQLNALKERANRNFGYSDEYDDFESEDDDDDYYY